jgi:spermidine/putrescine transport system permease protein
MIENGRGRYFLLLPSTTVFTVLFVAPFALFFVISFWRVKVYRLVQDFTLDNYTEAVREYLGVAVFTFSIALTIAITATVIAFGFAYVIRFKAGRYGQVLLFIALLTLFGGYLVKIYAWKTILGADGILSSGIIALGLAEEPLSIFLYNPGSVIVTLTHYLLPLAILPIYASLNGVSDITLDAARDIGARPWRVFVDILLPQCRQGLLAAFSLTFLLSAGDYVTPRLVGGPYTSMIGNFIESQFVHRLNWPLGAAMSFTVLLACFLMIVIVHISLKMILRPR